MNRVLPLLGVQQAGDHAAQGGLAAARLADEADDLALGDAQAHIVDGVHHFVAYGGAEPARDAAGEVRALTKRFVRPLASMIGASVVDAPPAGAVTTELTAVALPGAPANSAPGDPRRAR